MKLKDSYVTQEISGRMVMVGTAPDDFQGMIKLNASGMEIIRMLKEDVTEEQIIEKMHDKYEAEKSVIAEDVRGILDSLRSIGALEE